MNVYGYVYCVHNTVNGKLYVGQTKHSPAWRWKTHVNSSRKAANGNHFHSAIRRHGVAAFELIELAPAGSQEELKYLERLWILMLGSFDREVGYNRTFGGERGRYTPDTCQRISDSLKGRKPHPNTIAASVAAHKGFTPWNKGKCKPRAPRNRPVAGWKMTEEQKAKISAAHKGKQYPPERIEQMRKLMLTVAKKRCEHCSKECPPGTFSRWHGDNCKQKAA